MAWAPIFTAAITFSISTFISLQSRETPRLTLILVRSMDPTPSGSMQVCFLLAQITTFPDATKGISSSQVIRSFSATRFSSGVTIPFRAASICVAYSLIFSSSSLSADLSETAASALPSSSADTSLLPVSRRYGEYPAQRFNRRQNEKAAYVPAGSYAASLIFIFPYVGITQIRLQVRTVSVHSQPASASPLVPFFF